MGETTGQFHCRDCQQMHRNYNAMAATPREAVAMEAEEHWSGMAPPTRLSAASARASAAGCFKDNFGSERLMISMGVLDLPTDLKIAKNMWTQSKGDWYDLLAEMPPA